MKKILFFCLLPLLIYGGWLDSFEGSKQKESSEETINRLNTNLYNRFTKANPNATLLEIQKNADGYDEDHSNSALRIERMWTSENGTLIEFFGLSRPNAQFSAIIHKGSFRIKGFHGESWNLKEVDGIEEQVDGKGETALFVRPKDKFYVLFDKVDTYYPFSIDHLDTRKYRSVYFTDLDPRYIDRYHDAYKDADTPDKLYKFIVTYASNDPDKLMSPSLQRLLTMWRDRNDFEGYYSAYLIAQSSSDAKMAQNLARTAEHKAKLENMAVVTLVNKSRLFDFDLKINRTSVNNSEGSGLISNYNFTADASIKGRVSLKLNKNSPIKLKYGTYRVVLESTITYPRHYQRRSNWLGNADNTNPEVIKKEIPIIVNPTSQNTFVDVDFGTLTVAFFQRGIMGGYEAIWPNGADPRVSLKIKRVEFIR